MNKRYATALLGTAMAVVLAAPAQGQDAELERRVQEMEQELILLRRQLEGSVKTANEKADAAMEQAKKADGDKFKMSGPTPKWESEDGRFKIELDGRIHFDLAAFDEGDDVVLDQAGNDVDLNSGTNFRRARLGVKGTIDKDWKYELIFDGGDSSASGNVDIDVANIAYKGLDPVTFTAGKHKVPSSFEELTSSNDITFIERSLAANIGNTFSGKVMGISAKANGDFWWAGTGVGFGAEDDNADDEALSVHGRLALFWADKGMTLHGGINGAVLLEPLQDDSTRNCRFRDRPEIRVDGTRFIDARSQNRFSNTECYSWGVELAGSYGPFWAQAEYFQFGFDQSNNPADRTDLSVFGPDIDLSAFYIAAGIFLTGEDKRYSKSKAAWSSVKVDKPFSLSNGGMGAWELAARYSHADLNDEENTVDPVTGNFIGVAGGEQDNFTVALNWYVNNYIMFKLNYINVSTENRPAVGAAAVDFADFDAYGMRMQIKW